MNLIDKDVDFIWMPCIRWERKEDPAGGQLLQLPDRDELPHGAGPQHRRHRGQRNVEFLYPFVPYHDKVELKRRLYELLAVERVADAEAGRGRVRGASASRAPRSTPR